MTGGLAYDETKAVLLLNMVAVAIKGRKFEVPLLEYCYVYLLSDPG